MSNFGVAHPKSSTSGQSQVIGHRASGSLFEFGKRFFDVLICILLLPILFAFGVLLLVTNPAGNPGPLLFLQRRMGKKCKPFTALKFRTMLEGSPRTANEPLEQHRITPLGRFLRLSRVDELPQILNVLKGEMSLIGPRPDSFEHALIYLQEVPDYAARHSVLPGISGYAQTELGYAEGVDDTRRKVAADIHYITNRSLGLELWILWRTLQIVTGCQGR